MALTFPPIGRAKMVDKCAKCDRTLSPEDFRFGAMYVCPVCDFGKKPATDELDGRPVSLVWRNGYWWYE